jgi:hypothetical protein
MALKSSDLSQEQEDASARLAKRKPRKKKPTPESRVLRECLDLLLIRGIWAWRANAGAAQMPHGQWVHFGIKGQPDIIGLLGDGRFLGVECKGPSGKQSPNQKWFQANVEANNGVYLLVRSAKELDEKLKEVMK